MLKVNEPRYKRWGQPHTFRKLRNTAENSVEAGSAITIDNDSRS